MGQLLTLVRITYMLFGIAKRLQLNSKLKLYYDQTKTDVIKRYTYLGSTLDPHLNLSESLDKKYKKTSSKLRLQYNVSHLLSNVYKPPANCHKQPANDRKLPNRPFLNSN